MIAYSSLPDASVISNVSSVDGKSTGTVSTSKITQATENIEIPDEYYYQGAAFAALNFTIPENLQDMQTGYLVIAVPQNAAESDDNQCTTDDTLEIQYVLTTEVTPDPDPIPQSDAFGDMNLGMPEYRQLHYITEEEEESDDDEDEDSEPEMIDYEVWSDYGYYQTEDQASLVGKTQSSTPESPNNVNIWEANMVSDAKSTPWWDYSDREWPDPVADIENQCWLTDANGAWKQSGEFLRSFSGENIFGFGFRVSRSRGKKNSILNAAKINVQIYGVSPDTGDDGILLKEYTDTTHDYKELKTGSIGVYQYADTFLQNVVSSKAVNTIEDFPRIRVKARISDDHGESGLFNSYKKEPQQNSWVDEDDSFSKTLEGTTADLALSQDIEAYNSKNNQQGYLTFAEYLSFKFNIRHIGNGDRLLRR